MNNTNNNNRKIQNVIFDMDGTILDTESDISNCINYMLDKHGYSKIPFDAVKEGIGWGARYLVKHSLDYSFEISPQSVKVDNIIEDFFVEYMAYYREYAANHSKLYDGIEEGLDILYNWGYNLFVLTNKPHEVMIPTIECVGIGKYFVESIGEGTYEHKKPSIEIWDIMVKRHNLTPQNSIIVGDGIPDYKFSQASGCHICMCLYGITPKEELLELDAEKYAGSFAEVIDYIKLLN